MNTAPAQEPIAETDAEPLDLSPSQIASQGDSLTAYREAKALEKEKPELRRPFPTQPDKPAVEAKAPAAEPRQVSKRQQQINNYERTVAELKAKVEKLEAAPRQEPVARPVAIAEPPKQPVADATDEYDRYLAMPDAPKVADFQAKGKSYEQFTAAQQVFIQRKMTEEARDLTQRETTASQHVEHEKSRARKFQTDFEADPEAKKLFETVKATNTWPADAPFSREVLSLQTFYQLGLDNQARKARGEAEQPASSMHAIAEELMESEHKVALARYLSKPGELARLAALPDARTLLRAIRDIERDLTTPKPVKTTTQAGEPAITLTSSRATDPLDEETAAIRSGDQARYNELKREKRLRKAGLLK